MHAPAPRHALRVDRPEVRRAARARSSAPSALLDVPWAPFDTYPAAMTLMDIALAPAGQRQLLPRQERPALARGRRAGDPARRRPAGVSGDRARRHRLPCRDARRGRRAADQARRRPRPARARRCRRQGARRTRPQRAGRRSAAGPRCCATVAPAAASPPDEPRHRTRSHREPAEPCCSRSRSQQAAPQLGDAVLERAAGRRRAPGLDVGPDGRRARRRPARPAGQAILNAIRPEVGVGRAAARLQRLAAHRPVPPGHGRLGRRPVVRLLRLVGRPPGGRAARRLGPGLRPRRRRVRLGAEDRQGAARRLAPPRRAT